MREPLTLILPEWPAPARVRALSTTRAGGVSTGPRRSLNLGSHVDDDPALVAENRRRLAGAAGLPREPCWLDQVHGARVAQLTGQNPVQAVDAAVTTRAGPICTILTADCLPVLLCDGAGTVVAAAHGGWRGLAAGILAATVMAMAVEPDTILAWLGPAISAARYEVGTEVREAFPRQIRAAAFMAGRPGHWQCDLYAIARVQLTELGVRRIFGGGFCTWTDERFFSYRQDPRAGRMASMIWMT